MGLKDLIVTPIYMALFTLLAIYIRPHVTNKQTRKYFLPALWVRFAGAIALGLIYQFYYGGGDTFNYYNQSSIVYEAFLDKPIIGLKLLFKNNDNDSSLFNYVTKIYWYKAPSEFFVIRIAAFFSIFTLNAYSAISLFFAFFSFCGAWLMFQVIQEKFPEITNWIAYSILFIPSCIFWGTGILKDTIALGALGILFFSLHQIIEKRKFKIHNLLLLFLSCWLIYSVKIYILICFIPSVFIWWYRRNIRSIKNAALRISAVPILLSVAFGGGYLILDQVASTSDRYNLDSLAEWSYITSYDIRYFTGKSAGSGYDLGAQDGTWKTLLKLTPAAINVSLFRPYPWEVRNPLMLLSALEAMIFLVLTIRLLLKIRQKNIRTRLFDPMIAMMLLFSLVFAFAVGVSTYNFGSLSRYKVPLLPFYASTLIILCFKNPKSRTHTHDDMH